MSATFEARYPSRCDACGERIAVGDTLVYADDSPVHSDCASDDRPKPDARTARACASCFTTHAGECA